MNRRIVDIAIWALVALLCFCYATIVATEVQSGNVECFDGSDIATDNRLTLKINFTVVCMFNPTSGSNCFLLAELGDK